MACRETCTLPVRMDISTLDGVETVQLQDNAQEDNALNREIEGIGIETTWEGFLFAPPTRATLKEPEAILLLSKADDLVWINPTRWISQISRNQKGSCKRNTRFPV